MDNRTEHQIEKTPEVSAQTDAEKISRRTAMTMRIFIITGLALFALFGYWSVNEGSLWEAAAGTVPMALTWYMTSLVAVLGVVGLGGVFTKMKRGIGPQNIKAIGILFVAVLVALLAISGAESESALGILGAIVGYLFGKDTSSDDNNS